MTAPSTKLERIQKIKDTIAQLTNDGQYLTLNAICKLNQINDSWAYRNPEAKAIHEQFSLLMIPKMLEKLKGAIAQLDEQNRFLKLESLCAEFGIDHNWAKTDKEVQKIYREWAERRKDEIKWNKKFAKSEPKIEPIKQPEVYLVTAANGNGRHESNVAVLPKLSVVDDIIEIETRKALADALTDMGQSDVLDDLQKRIIELERQNQRLKEENRQLREGQSFASLEDAITKEITGIDTRISGLEQQIQQFRDKRTVLIDLAAQLQERI